jgi:hypothetical protein
MWFWPEQFKNEDSSNEEGYEKNLIGQDYQEFSLNLFVLRYLK